MLCLIKTAVAWVILMLVSTNFLGMVVRQLVPTREEKKLEENMTGPAVQKIFGKYRTQNKHISLGVAVFFVVLSVIYLYALLRFWNIGVVAAAVMLMLARLPDLLWEIRTGQKVSHKNAPKGFYGFLATVLSWGALPVLWFALCRR